MSDPIIVIGAGQAGLQIAESLRNEGYDGSLILIGEEEERPYHRPPLSKAVLMGDMTPDQIEIRGPEFFTRKAIDWRSGVKVRSLDRIARRVTLEDGSTLAYRRLALATGARSRPLPTPGADRSHVFALRTLADTRALAERLPTIERLVVIGGGFIGLEVAAAARKRSIAVTVLEAGDRLMARAVAPVISRFYLDLHRHHGVDIHFGCQIDAIEPEAVVTAGGVRWPADAVLVGIGALANDELAASAGLLCERGILVDACSRTSDENIVAAGDCTVRRTENGESIRLESVQNAVEQAKAAAASLLGKEKPFTAAPWFWSDQYGVKLQMVGNSSRADCTVIRGKPDSSDWSVFHFRADRLVAVESVNRPQDHMAGRKLIDRNVTITLDQAADPTLALSSLL